MNWAEWLFQQLARLMHPGALIFWLHPWWLTYEFAILFQCVQTISVLFRKDLITFTENEGDKIKSKQASRIDRTLLRSNKLCRMIASAACKVNAPRCTHFLAPPLMAHLWVCNSVSVRADHKVFFSKDSITFTEAIDHCRQREMKVSRRTLV